MLSPYVTHPVGQPPLAVRERPLTAHRSVRGPFHLASAHTANSKAVSIRMFHSVHIPDLLHLAHLAHRVKVA